MQIFFSSRFGYQVSKLGTLPRTKVFPTSFISLPSGLHKFGKKVNRTVREQDAVIDADAIRRGKGGGET